MSAAQLESDLKQGEMQGVGKKLHWNLFDTHKLATGDADIELFRIGVGQNGNGFSPKTRAQTNVRSGIIPKGQRFTMHGLIPYLYAGTSAINNATYLKIQQFLRQAMVRIKFPGGDDIFQERLDFIFGEQKNWLHVPTTAGDNIFPGQLLTPHAYEKLNEPIKFAALDDFEFHLENLTVVDSSMNNMEITFRKVGYLERISS